MQIHKQDADATGETGSSYSVESTSSASVDNLWEAYRADLVRLEQKSQDAYDKAILALSGGALGLSLAFVRDYLGKGSGISKAYLIAAWASWSFSLVAVLYSFESSRRALRHATVRFDMGARTMTELDSRSSRLTSILNAGAGSLFLLGVLFFSTFVVSSNADEGESTSYESHAIQEPSISARITDEAIAYLLEGREFPARQKLRAAIKLDPNNKNAIALLRSIEAVPLTEFRGSWRPYRVKHGDTLMSLARRTSEDPTMLRLLIMYNSLSSAELKEGQVIRLPDEKPGPPASRPESPPSPPLGRPDPPVGQSIPQIPPGPIPPRKDR